MAFDDQKINESGKKLNFRKVMNEEYKQISQDT